MIYPIARIIVPPIIKLWLRKVDGLYNIPKNRGFIVAINHSSYYDTLLIPSIVIPKANRRLHAWANNYYWNNFITKFFLDLWGGIPVYIEKDKKSKGKNKIAFEKALDYLKKEHIMMIFPEGRRSSDGKLQKAYSGIARLVMASKAPVLPVGVIDAHKVVPKGSILPRFTRCKVNIGKPIYFKNYYGKKANDKIAEDITRQIMKEIAKLTGQKYNH